MAPWERMTVTPAAGSHARVVRPACVVSHHASNGGQPNTSGTALFGGRHTSSTTRRMYQSLCRNVS